MCSRRFGISLLCSFQTVQEWALGGNPGGRPPAGSRGIKAPDLLTWSPRPLRWLRCGVRTGAVQIGQAVTELSLLVSKRRSLSFNHNSGLQPGPSHSCCLRPSSCGFRDGIPHALLVVYFSYYPWSGHSHPTPDINKAFLSLAVRTSETFSAQHSTDELVGAAAVLLLRCCWAP